MATRPRPTPYRVYDFGNGRATGATRSADRDRLGGKGATLADLSRAGLPVPPGFTIPTDACGRFLRTGRLPAALIADVRRSIVKIEKATGKRFGDPKNPLLLAVRSGAPTSMPGMMETVLNVGLNDVTVEGLAAVTGNTAFALDCYRRLIAMSAVAVAGAARHRFEDAWFDAGLDHHTEPAAEKLRDVVARYQSLYEATAGGPFPQDPMAQLTQSIEAVFRSWAGERAERYRAIHHIADTPGTAVTVQAMVFGNLDDDSATGVAFTRDPSTGEHTLYGEFLVNAQGEDVVAGTRTPNNVKTEMALWSPKAARELRAAASLLEARYRDAQDFEFTIERGTLYLLQTRTAKRTAAAAVRIAVEMVKRKLIDEATAVARVDPALLDRLRQPVFDPAHTPAPIATGLPASPGAAVGRLAFTAAEAEARTTAGETVILVRPETDPADIAGLHAAAGVLTATGGMTSHAAVVARDLNRPCVVGVAAMRLDPAARTLTIKTARRTRTFGPDDVLSFDGTTGHVYAGKVPTIASPSSAWLRTLLRWADEQAGPDSTPRRSRTVKGVRR